jgi:phage terminase large subunit
MKAQTVLEFDKFKLRPYQVPLFSAIESGKYKRMVAIWPRRAGKDIVAFNALFRAAIDKKGNYLYVFPTFAQARRVIWDSITNTGMRFIDFIPQEYVESKNSQELKIVLKNGSAISLVGSDKVDALMGSNAQAMIFSEYALQDPMGFNRLSPILLGSGGWALFISTPRGKNHLFTTYQTALNDPGWFAQKLSVLDTGHISLHDIERERAQGLMSEDLIQQEYFCSFELGVEGSYYARYIDKLRIDGRIGVVPFEAGFKVHTAWDIGVRDSTSIIFFQVIGQTVRLIDFYENSKVGLEHYVKVLQSKEYNYGVHIAPHDIAVKEWGSGQTRLEKAKNLGIDFIIADNLNIMDGIESVRSAFSKIWIDQDRCRGLIIALENYRQEYDQTHKVYKSQPLHDIFSHAADAMRYLCISLPKTQDGLSAEELEKIYQEAVMGPNQSLPKMFRDDEHNTPFY